MTTTNDNDYDNDNGSKHFPWKWILIGVFFVSLFASWFLLPLEAWMQSFNQWIKGLGAVGYLIFASVYILATVALVPGSILTLAAGLTFGLWGIFPVVLAATIGAGFAFMVARYLARDAIKQRYENDKRFKAIDAAVNEEGWKIVGLLRLSPLIPFNLQNYLYGLTDIRFGHYVLATFFGIMPGSLMYVYLGAVGKATLGDSSGNGDPALQWSLFAVGLLATIVVTVLVTRKAKAKLDEIGVQEPVEQAHV